MTIKYFVECVLYIILIFYSLFRGFRTIDCLKIFSLFLTSLSTTDTVSLAVESFITERPFLLFVAGGEVCDLSLALSLANVAFEWVSLEGDLARDFSTDVTFERWSDDGDLERTGSKFVFFLDGDDTPTNTWAILDLTRSILVGSGVPSLTDFNFFLRNSISALCLEIYSHFCV